MSKTLKSRHLLVNRVIALLEKISRKDIYAPRDVTHDPLVKINEGLKFKNPSLKLNWL